MFTTSSVSIADSAYDIPEDIYKFEQSLKTIKLPPYNFVNYFKVRDEYKKFDSNLRALENKYASKHPRLFILRGLFYEKYRNFDKAYATYAEARKRFPTYIYAYFFAAVLYQKKGNYLKCNELLKDCVNVLKEDGRTNTLSPLRKQHLTMAYLLLKESHLVLGKNDEAKEVLGLAKEMDPEFVKHKAKLWIAEILEMPINNKKNVEEDLLYLTPGAISEGVGEVLRLSYNFITRNK